MHLQFFFRQKLQSGREPSHLFLCLRQVRQACPSASGQGRYHPDVKDEDPYALLRKSGLWLVRQGLCDGAGFGKVKKMSEEVR